MPLPNDEQHQAAYKLGYKWKAWRGIPVKGTPGYPDSCQVRQLLSPDQLASWKWKSFFESVSATDATGDEPLSYSYCSNGSDVAPLPSLEKLKRDEKLAAYDREHDPTPITPELVIAEGAVQTWFGGYRFEGDITFSVCNQRYFPGEYALTSSRTDSQIKTLGELRTALRLARGK